MADHAAASRRLLRAARQGALATLALDPVGFPYTSLVAVADDGEGRPLLLLSSLAEHTRNLAAHPEASLLVTTGGDGDPLAAARVTLLGPCAPVPEADEPAARQRYLDAHPSAQAYAGFRDFRLFRLSPVALRYIEGFGRMSWVDASDYLAATLPP